MKEIINIKTYDISIDAELRRHPELETVANAVDSIAKSAVANLLTSMAYSITMDDALDLPDRMELRLELERWRWDVRVTARLLRREE